MEIIEDFYKGRDLYSDGEIEDTILNHLKNQISEEEIFQQFGHSWPIHYHFSPQRTDLLSWFPFEPDSHILEIGSGCGALTGFFYDNFREVTAIELSKKRSLINLERIKNRIHSSADCSLNSNKRSELIGEDVNKKKLTIYTGNLLDIEIKQTFDYVTLIGVLEYTRSFVITENPYKTLFDKIHSFLKPNGTLIIAIENKFGFKYWSGLPEDHTGNMFEGLTGYLNLKDYHEIQKLNDDEKGKLKNQVETFSLQELTELLAENNLEIKHHYYPYPDYKLPTEVYSNESLPGPENFMTNVTLGANYCYDLFNCASTYASINKNSMFPFFSNSFLFFVQKKNL